MGSLAKKCPHGKSLDVDCVVCKKMDLIQRRKDEQIAAYILSLEGLQAERDGLREALQQIADGNPAPPGGKWLSDAKMAQIARRALEVK